jgi:hypothetical protein
MSAPFTYANELGIIRKEIVASTIDTVRIDQYAGQPNGCKLHTRILRAPNNVTGPKQRLMTQSLLDTETGNPLEIPAGATIRQVKACRIGDELLDNNLAILVGYICQEVSGKDAKKVIRLIFKF